LRLFQKNQPVRLLAFDASPPKKSPVALVIWFHISSGFDDIAFFDAASPQKQSTCGVTGL